MDQPRDRNEAMPEANDDTPVAPLRRKWQTPRVLLADRHTTRNDCMANHDGPHGLSS